MRHRSDAIAVLDLGSVLIFSGDRLDAFPASLRLPRDPGTDSEPDPIHTLTRVARARFERRLRLQLGTVLARPVEFSHEQAIDPDFARAWRQVIGHLFILAADTPEILQKRAIREQYSHIMVELLVNCGAHSYSRELSAPRIESDWESSDRMPAFPLRHASPGRTDSFWIGAAL